MKLTGVLILIAMISATAGNIYSQNTRISMNLKNATIVDIFREIERNTEFGFFFKNEEMNLEKRQSIKVSDATIEEVLKKVLDENCSYKILDRNIVITKGNVEITQQQEFLVTGKVTDQSGAPLPGVSVSIKGTTIGVITDNGGNYSLTIAPPNTILIFSFMGMKTQEITAAGKTIVNVRLEDEFISLEEVVAVGYGTVKKADLTGAVTSVSAKDFDKVPASSPLQALQGRAPGIQITTYSGMPGSGANVLIRGVKSINGTSVPLYVVDGVIRGSIDNLNPNSIESVSVLKDASAAAIYGARAANGVVLVTTKRGSDKKDVEITLNTYRGIQTEGNLKLKLLNSSQFLQLLTESYQNAGKDLEWNNDILSHYTGIDTNWKDLMTQTGIIQNYDLSVSGGSEKSNYFISAGYHDHKGMILETGYKKYTLTFNSDHKINDWMKFGNSLALYYDKREGTVKKGGINSEPYEVALRKIPLSKAYEDNGDYGAIFNSSLEQLEPNPIWMAKEITNEQIGKGIQGNLYLTLKLLKGLEFTTRGSLDYNNYYTTFFKPGIPPSYGWAGSPINLVEKDHSEDMHWISDFLLNYSFTKKDHDLKLLVGYSLEESTHEALWGSRTGTPNNQIRFLNAGNPIGMINGNGFSDWAFSSLFSRMNYSWKNKYLLTGTIRRDGASRLIESNRYGIFPSASLAWRASEEPFLKRIGCFDDLKFRASYGSLGNILSVKPYGTIATLSTQNSILNNEQASAYSLTTAVNSDLKWESALKKNIGVDAAFLSNKLYLTADYFIENTYDLIFDQPISLSTGLSGLPLINAGEMKNKGYEFEIGYRVNKPKWRFDFSFNISHVENEVIDLGERNLRTSGLVEGYPARSYFGYKSDGIIKDQSQLSIYTDGSFKNKQIGDIHLLDIDGYDSQGNLTGAPDGKVDAADRTLIGKKYPDFVYGGLGTVGYKNWSLQVQLQGVQGIDMSYSPGGWEGILMLMTGLPRNEDARILNRYHPVNNPTGTWPRLDISDKGLNMTYSEFWLEDASYLRVKNVNLNYNLSKKYCGKIGMKELGLYVSVENAYTFTKFTGPEVDTTSDPLIGISQPRTWVLGLKATF